MSDAILTAARRVLNISWWEEENEQNEPFGVPPLVFFQEPDPSDILVGVAFATWREMGEPERVTIKVQPGDTLNE